MVRQSSGRYNTDNLLEKRAWQITGAASGFSAAVSPVVTGELTKFHLVEFAATTFQIDETGFVVGAASICRWRQLLPRYFAPHPDGIKFLYCHGSRDHGATVTNGECSRHPVDAVSFIDEPTRARFSAGKMGVLDCESWWLACFLYS